MRLALRTENPVRQLWGIGPGSQPRAPTPCAQFRRSSPFAGAASGFVTLAPATHRDRSSSGRRTMRGAGGQVKVGQRKFVCFFALGPPPANTCPPWPTGAWRFRMSRQALFPLERIERSILVLRGLRVILDQDLACLFGVAAKVMNQAGRRNIERFPGDFMLRLTSKEGASLRSRSVT